MSSTSANSIVNEVQPVHIPLQLWLMMIGAGLVMFMMLNDNALLLRSGAGMAHELFHDGRHLLGVPCH